MTCYKFSKERVKEEQEPRREGKVGTSISACNIKKLMAAVKVSLPQHIYYAKFCYFFESNTYKTRTK